MTPCPGVFDLGGVGSEKKEAYCLLLPPPTTNTTTMYGYGVCDIKGLVKQRKCLSSFYQTKTNVLWFITNPTALDPFDYSSSRFLHQEGTLLCVVMV